MPDYNDTTRYDGDLLVHKELYEFARDIVRVTNPTNRPFKWRFDGRWYIMQPGEIKDKERYWTDHYSSKLAEQVIGDMILAQGEAQIEAQSKSNSDILYDKYIESMRIWNRLPKKNDPELLRKIMTGIVLGCVTKYGADEVDLPENEPIEAGQLRDKSFEQQLLEELSNRPLTPQEPISGVSDRVVAAVDDPNPPVTQQPQAQTLPPAAGLQPFTPPPVPTKKPYEVTAPVAQVKPSNQFTLPQTAPAVESEVTQ